MPVALADMTKVLVPRVPSLQGRPALGPTPSLLDSSGPDMAAPATHEETAARGPG
jgi:hypothetical protein